MNIEDRIKQFQQMAESDPNNELGHFSLGKAYLEAGRFEEAAASLERVITINPKMSKAYQLLGDAYDKAGARDKAVEVVTHGVTVADELGDRMPRDAMADALRAWNAPVPELSAKTAATGPATSGASDSGFACSRCGQPVGQLEKPPFKGPMGVKIHASTCSTCWREWLPMGTKVINELGLTLASEVGQKTYDQYMLEFLQLEEL